MQNARSKKARNYASGEYGLAMKELTEMQQKFVLHLLDHGGKYTDAAKAAGYSDNSANSLRVQAHRLAHDKAIIAAIREQGESYMRAGVAHGVHALIDIARDPTHKDRLRAADKLLARAGLGENTTRTVKHVHELNEEQLKNRIRMLDKRNGLDADKLLGEVGVKQIEAPKEEPIDVVFQEVPAEVPVEAEGLEDLL